MRTTAAALALSALAALGGCSQHSRAPGGSATEEKELHIYNWADYIAKSTIADFEARTGIKVIYDTYDAD